VTGGEGGGSLALGKYGTRSAVPPPGMISERNCEILRMKELGGNLAVIARRFKISTTRVRQILDRYGTS